MSTTPTDWEPAPVRAREVEDTEEQSRGWINTMTEEVIIRQPLIRENKPELPEFGAYHYSAISESLYKGRGRKVLFRGNAIGTLDERIESLIEEAETPEYPGMLDRAIDSDQVRRERLETVASLEDWAHIVGAEYYIGEKIGNTKQSSGSVAIYGGNTRRGEGAYVALASVNGPGGRRYASVGYSATGVLHDRPAPLQTRLGSYRS